MKKLLIGLIVYTLSIGPVFAQTTEDKVCFPLSEAKTLSVEVEKGRDCEVISVKQDVRIANLNKTIETLNQKIAKLEEINSKYDKVVVEHEKLVKNLEKACDARVADAKPSLGTMVSGALGILGIGILLGILL